MSTQLASYFFPDVYSTLVNDYTGTVKYISSTGSDSNNGNSVTTPYLTIDYAYTQTTATSRVMYVILSGTYTMTAINGTYSDASIAIRDGGNERIYVGCPGRTTIQWTANTNSRDCAMVDFGNTASKIYGAIIKRNNNGRSGSYVVAYFKGTTKGNFYNCVFSETNANGSWSYQYDNYAYNNIGIRNCTIYNASAPSGNYTNAGTCLTIDTVFNTTCTTGGTETNVLKSQSVSGSDYSVSGVTTAGVYSGTYAWNATRTVILTPVTVSSSTGATVTTASPYAYYTFNGSGSITFGTSGSIDCLLVAGGGGGGWDVGGGGGAGGLIYNTYAIAASTLTVTIGAGGTGAASGVVASNGSNTAVSGSGFTTLSALGGGGGGSWSGIGGAAGGSGGGGTSNTTSVAAGTAGQGNNGGAGSGNAGGTAEYSGAA